MFKCEIKRRTSKRDIVKTIEDTLPSAMEQVMIHAQSIALRYKVGSKSDKLIPYKISKNGNIIEGTLYTNFSNAPFLEYGTGKLSDGTMPHIGHTKTFKESGMTYWWIPPDLSKDGEWHLVFTQSARPFMRPTAFELEKSAKEILAKVLISALKKG